MKYIIAVIKPHKLDEVREALTALNVQGMTISEVKGYGRQRGQKEIYRGAEYTVSFVPKIKLEVAVDDAIADQVIDRITATVRTGQIGDGLREIDVTEYWLELLVDSSCLPAARMAELLDETRQLIAIFTSIDRKAKCQQFLIPILHFSLQPSTSPPARLSAPRTSRTGV